MVLDTGRSRIRGPGWLVFGENSLLGLLITTFSLYPSMAFPGRVHAGVGVEEVSSYYDVTNPIELGPHP